MFMRCYVYVALTVTLNLTLTLTLTLMTINITSLEHNDLINLCQTKLMRTLCS